VLGRTPLHFAAQFNRAALAKLLVQKGATVDAVDNQGETATQIAERLKWKKVAAILTDPSVLFWNFANRANKLYKATEYDLAIAVYEQSFALLHEVSSTCQVKLRLSPKQRAKPAASRTRTCTNSAVCIASGECDDRQLCP
jgi:hypothetical protein